MEKDSSYLNSKTKATIKQLYSGDSRFETFTLASGNEYNIYHLLIFKLKANTNTDVYMRIIAWGVLSPSVSDTPYIKWNFKTGKKSDSNEPMYTCDARVWGGDPLTIGYVVDSYNTDNWRVGIVGLTGIRFYI